MPRIHADEALWLEVNFVGDGVPKELVRAGPEHFGSECFGEAKIADFVNEPGVYELPLVGVGRT